MGLFESVEEMPTEGAIRGLTGEASEEADKAIADGKPRALPFNAQNEKLVKAIKRYLSSQGWGCKVRVIQGRVYWQVVEKKEITPEHKAKMLSALEEARKKKEAAKAAAAPSNGNIEPAKKAQEKAAKS